MISRLYCITLYYLYGHQHFSLWMPKENEI